MKINLLLLLTLITFISKATTIEKTLEHSLKGINKILIFNGAGNVEITANKSTKSLKGKYFVRMDGDNNTVTNHIDNDMTIYARVDKKKLTLKFGYDKNTKKSYKKARIDIELIIPEEIFIDLRSDDGSVLISNLTKGGRITDKKGDIKLKNIRGSLTVNDGSGDILIESSNSKLKINDNKGHITVKKHNGSLIINDKSGHISLTNTQGKIKISDGTGNINITKNVGFVKVVSKKDSVAMDDIQGNVKINMKSGSLNLKDIKGDVKLAVKDSSQVITKNILGKITYIEKK